MNERTAIPPSESKGRETHPSAAAPTHSAPAHSAPTSNGAGTFAPAVSAAALKAWMISYLAQLLSVDERQVDPGFSFELYGLDSTAAVGLSGDLGELLGREFDPSIAYDHPTIDALVEHLVTIRAVRAA